MTHEIGIVEETGETKIASIESNQVNSEGKFTFDMWDYIYSQALGQTSVDILTSIKKFYIRYNTLR